MIHNHQQQRYETRVVHLGFMGSILVLSETDKGFEVTSYKKGFTLRRESSGYNVYSMRNIIDCVKLFLKPTAMMFIIPAGTPVNSVIKNLSERFQLDDLSLSEVHLCLSQNKTKKILQKLRLKLPAAGK